MTDYTLEMFIRDCRGKISESQNPADCVEKTAAVADEHLERVVGHLISLC